MFLIRRSLELKCKDFIQILRQQADESRACSWDNVGLLVGSMQKEIKKVYIALDASDEAVSEAAAAEADFLLTHHPLIFQGIMRCIRILISWGWQSWQQKKSISKTAYRWR